MAEDKNYTNATHEEGEQEIDLMEYVSKLWVVRKLLMKVAGIAVIVGIVIAFSIPKTYTAEVSLSPEIGKTGGNSLSGMAAMLGIGNINMGAEASALNITMTPDILASTPFIIELLNTQVRTLDGETDTTLVAYMETQSVPWWSTIIGLPGMAIQGIKSLISQSDNAEEVKPLDPFHLTKEQNKQIGAIRSIITSEVEKKTGLTKIGVTLQDPLVAATLADTVLVKLQKYITNYKTSKAKEDCKYWEELHKERQKEYFEAQERYARYTDKNQGVILQSVKIEQERLQNEQSLAFQVFSQVATQLQMARAKLQEEKPAFTVLEPASVPVYPSGTSRKMILIVVVFMGVAGASAWILFGKDLWANLKKALKERTEGKE